jgi:mannose-6-phosphate isomerase
MQKNSLRIDVLGTSFSIAAEEDRLYLDGLLKRYKLKIEEVQKNADISDPLRTAILTGFILYDEIEKMRAGNTAAHSKYEYMRIGERLETLSSRIDEVIGDGSFLAELPANRLFRLKNAFKHYDWGSPEWIPALLGIHAPELKPWAEMWMGTHPGGSSLTECFGKETPLKTVSGELPFLFKLLAAEKPLSIQAHPNLEQAAAGFARENAAGIAFDAPERNYKDPNHKPEMLCALTPFTAMAGFRERREIIELFDTFACPALVSLRRELRGEASDRDAYRSFLQNLFSLPQEQKDDLAAYITRHIGEVKFRAGHYRKEWELIEDFHARFPGDPSVIAPLYLNVISLDPGDAIYLPAGILHAYVHGAGVELMSQSDNVLRGGLTKKCVDAGELLAILEPAPFKPAVIRPVPEDDGYAVYPAPAKEWRLSVITSQDGRKTRFPETKRAILIVTRGRLAVTFPGGQGAFPLARGESVFIPESSADGFFLEGAFTAYAASCVL